jgi:molybdopterin synthase sulfur carrier subunit
VQTITLKLPHALGAEAGRREFELHAKTVRHAIAALDTHREGLTFRIFDERGQLRKHLMLYVGDTNTSELNGLDTALSGGDVVTVIMAVSGG